MLHALIRCIIKKKTGKCTWMYECNFIT